MEKISSTLKIDLDKNIGVLCGGPSTEREISLRSGENCLKALKRLGYKNAQLIDVDKNIAKILIEKNIEVAYIALHGKYGEDGAIQGLLEVLEIPYTGSGIRASSMALDKEITKKILSCHKIPVLNSIIVYDDNNLSENIKNLNYPLMVKPLCQGSSIGMSKVSNSVELLISLNEALKYKSGVMIEEYIQGKSLTVGVLDSESKTFSTPVLEFNTKNEWYDFECKYTKGLTEFILPANINKCTTEIIKELAIKSHKAIGATGISRVDFMLDKNNNSYVLEINTVPGMTDLSDLPAQAKAMDIEYDELVGIILNSSTFVKDVPIEESSKFSSLC